MTEEIWEVPEGWQWSTIGQLCQVNQRDPAFRAMPDDLRVSFVPMAAVNADLGSIATPQVRPLGDVRKGFTPFTNGDVIFAKITPSMENGKAAIARGLENGLGFGSTEFHVLKPQAEVLPDWVFHFIRRQAFRNEAKANFSGTAGQLRVPDRFIRDAPIPFAPITEQERIVQRIGNLFAQSRTARQALEHVPALLKQFRQAVLLAAFRGELTEREPSDEPATDLLARIKDGGRPNRKGGRGKNSGDPEKKRIAGPQPPDSRNLPKLPTSWCWTTLDHLLLRIEAGHSPTAQGRPAMPDEYGVLKVSAVTWGEFRPEENKALLPGPPPNVALTIRADDLLITRANTVSLVGAAVLVDKSYPYLLLSDKTLRLVPVIDELPRSFLLYALRTQWARDALEDKATGTSNSMRNISQSTIRSVPIALPPLAEQYRIVARVEALLTTANAIERAVEVAQRRAESVDQAILARAFRGELV